VNNGKDWTTLFKSGDSVDLQLGTDPRADPARRGPVPGDGWPRGGPGERLQWLDGHVYGHGWHGTIRRFTADLEPSPGVVLGGASGSFIGHLDQSSELFNGRGMARLRDGLFAVSGLGGILHLMTWGDEKQQMTLVRRIGCVPACRGIGLDRQGNVWWYAGAWAWDDRPDTPLRFGVNPPEFPWAAQAVMLDNDNVVVPCYLWGRPTFYSGPLTKELRGQRLDKGCALTRDRVGSAVTRADGRLALLTSPRGRTATASTSLTWPLRKTRCPRRTGCRRSGGSSPRHPTGDGRWPCARSRTGSTTRRG